MTEPRTDLPKPTIEDTVAGLERAVAILRKVMWMGALVVLAMLVYIAVLTIQIGDLNGQLDDIKTQTDKIGGFVDELEQERADPNSDGVGVEELRHVFGLVEDTAALLCNQYPDDPVCVQG